MSNCHVCFTIGVFNSFDTTRLPGRFHFKDPLGLPNSVALTLRTGLLARLGAIGRYVIGS